MTRRKRLRFQNRVLLITFLTVAPFVVATTILLYLSGVSPPLRWTILGFLGVGALIGRWWDRRSRAVPETTTAAAA